MQLTELTIEEQREILKQVFDFEIIDQAIEEGRHHYVIYDADGNEFYGYDENSKYDLTSIFGIIKYAQDRAIKLGHSRCQSEIRKSLGFD